MIESESVKFIDTGLKGECHHVIYDGVYMISPNECSDETLGISEKSILPNYSLNCSQITGEAHQRFIIKHHEKSDYFTIMALNSFLFLGVENKEKETDLYDSKVVQNSESDDHLFKWQIYFDGNYNIQLKGTNYCFEYDKEKKEVKLAKKKKKSDSQKFKITVSETIKSGLYYIQQNELFITFSRTDISQGSFLCKKNKKEDQVFYVIFDKNDGCYSIFDIYSIKCFSPSRNPTTKSYINQNSFYNLEYQKWIIGKYDNNCDKYFIILKSDNLFLYSPKIYLNLNNYDWKSTNDCFRFQPFSRSFFSLSKSNEETNLEKYKDEIEKTIEHCYLPKIVASDMSKLQDLTLNREFLENCKNLVDLEIPNSFINVDENAFVNCTRIKTIRTHPKWLIFLPNPINVENIVVPYGVEIIEYDYFQHFHNLKYLSLPKSLKFENCDKNAFKDIYGLKVFEGDPIFLSIMYKDELTKLFIPNFVSEITEDICAGCKSLKEVNFEKDSNVTVIKSRAFADCDRLRYFVVPEKVINIAPDAFSGCNKNLDLVLTNENQKLSMKDSLVIDPTKDDITNEYKLCFNITSLEIPLDVVNCNTDIFKKFKNLIYVKCHPKWLDLFIADNIEVVLIPDKVTQIKKEYFEKLNHLKFVDIPESVEEIELGSFDNCKELTSIKCGTKHFKYLNHAQFKTINLNEQVSHISICDFEGFSNLETCIIPSNIQHISPNAFINCKKLMKVDHPNGKSFINNSVIINEDKIEILKDDFEGWTNLKKLVIPSSVTKIEEDAFKDCINLKCITCDPKWFPFIPKNSIRKVVIPDYVKEIKKGQFDDFYSMIYIKLPKEIEIDDECIFDLCESLKIIKCKASIFAKLSDKTIERCDNKIKQKYENPIFNFQPDQSKVHDETELIPQNDINETMCVTFSNTIYSTLATTTRKTSVDDLVALDPKVNQYRRHINNVLWAIQSGEGKITNKPKDTSIHEISNVCGFIFNKIYKKFKIIPRIGQIYTVLYLADEILNNKKSHGAIAEVKPGEGKTFILTVLSIILVKYGHTIDITKSNLNQAKKDYNEQKIIFKLFDIETSVFYDKRADRDLLSKTITFNKPNYFNEYKEYDQSEFTKFNLKSFDCPVVYSTNRNYEYYYLHTLFSMIPRKRSLDIVLIDEVDNMLIDELESPANISKEINYASAQRIFCLVYSTQYMKVKDIISLLKKNYPNAGDFKEEEVELLRNAALEANNKIKDVDYIIKNNKIVIIDHNTGVTMPSSHWQNYVHEMVEIKEFIIPGPATISFCQVTQQSYFNLYQKIAGVTGSLGNESEEKILKEGYDINCIRVPSNTPSKIEVYYKIRPESIEDILDLVYEDSFTEKFNKRPVLVIWDSIYNAKKFMKFLMDEIKFKNFGTVFGEDLDEDDEAIKNAGTPGRITIATSAACRNANIEIKDRSAKQKGLHVVIPMKLSNLRSLEQAVGRTGRYGQPGSVTILISQDDLYIKTPKFNQSNNNLVNLQLRFSQYIRTIFPWLLCGTGKNSFDGNSQFPFYASYSDIMNILSSRIFLIFKNLTDLNKFQDLAWIMVQTSWGVFFTSLLNDKLNSDNLIYCEREYIRFIRELDNFINPNKSRSINSAINYLKSQFKNDENKDFIIYKNLKISADNVEFIHAIGKVESTNDEQPEQQKDIFSYLVPKGIKKIKTAYDYIMQKYNENKKLIPTKGILDKTPSIELDNIDIELIKTAMTIAKEAYDCGKFSKGRVIFGCETNELCKPKFYCVEHLNNLFVATKGSSIDVDFLTDVSCYEMCENINGNSYYFHSGFYASAKYILSNITEFIERDYEKIYFVGHSLGAAVSNVLCFLAKTDEKLKNKKIYSMAFAPPPSMSRVPAYIQDCMYSFINKEDFIPHMSLSNILNTVDLRQVPLPSLFDYWLRIFKSYKNEKIVNLTNFLEKYKDEILKTFQSVHDELHVRKNIGNIFFIGFSDSSKLRNYQVDETDLQNTIFIPPSLIAHHSIDDYIKTFSIIKSY